MIAPWGMERMALTAHVGPGGTALGESARGGQPRGARPPGARPGGGGGGLGPICCRLRGLAAGLCFMIYPIVNNGLVETMFNLVVTLTVGVVLGPVWGLLH